MKTNDTPHHDNRREADTNLDDIPDPQESALDTAEDLREDLEALAASDLPFAHDAQQILNALENANRDEGDTR
jgi:hypothetical protein